MAEQQQQTAKAQILNDRTYQEVEYLKKNLGPILVAALAEICIRRPADPIEYLAHWLLRWRYNEELKRRDVQNALEVVRQKAWTKDDESLAANPTAPDQPLAPETFTQGFTPGAPYAPPGFGGPLDPNAVEQAVAPPTDEAAPPAEAAPPPEAPLGEAEVALGGVPVEPAGETVPGNGEKRPSAAEGEKRGSLTGEKRPSQGGAEGAPSGGEVKRASGAGVEGQRGSVGGEPKRPSMEKRVSGDPATVAAPEVLPADMKRKSGEKRPSAELEGKQASGPVPTLDANNAAEAPAPEAVAEPPPE